MILDRLEPLYDATLRRVGPAHAVLRGAVWAAGGLAVRLASAATAFELPPDHLLPLYKLQFLLGTYERGTVRACRRLLRPGMTAVDVGAHAGYYTVLFSRLAGPGGRVLAFEPHPTTFAVLERNVRRRSLANVILSAAAVSDRDGEGELWETPVSVGHTLLAAKPGTGPARRVPTVRLDTAARTHGMERVDLVKIDVEGAEAEVLAGMAELSARSPALSVILEYKPEILRARGDDLPGFLARLGGQGFPVVWALSDSAPPRRADPRDPTLRSWPKCNLLAQRA